MYQLLISVEELQARLGKSDLLILDVRHDLNSHEAGRLAYEEGHIPGARFLDHETQLSAPRTGQNGRHPLPAMADFKELMRGLGLRPDTQVVSYDGSGGMFATHLWWMLRWIGHDKVAVLDGGWPAWLASGGEVETTVHASPALQGPAEANGRIETASAAMPIVSSDEVLENISRPTFTVIDARAENRYRGEVEPMDPVAGHIPGALNRPHTRNLSDEGRFKPADQLRSEFAELLAATAPSDIVHQCGSGITATHNLFAMELAGMSGSRLYPGSWSEWCSDPARPVARGDAA